MTTRVEVEADVVDVLAFVLGAPVRVAVGTETVNGGAGGFGGVRRATPELRCHVDDDRRAVKGYLVKCQVVRPDR